MEGLNAGIIVWVSLTAKGMQDFFPGQAVFKCLARILASKVAVQNDPFCIPDVQARILYRFHCQFRCHRCAIGIADDFTAAQIHDRRQISPSFFLHMDVGNICAPFLIDGFRSKITFQDIHFIIWDTAMIGMVVVLLYYHRAQSLLCHMPLDPLDTAGCPNAIEYTA